jgi:hypothetical protein
MGKNALRKIAKALGLTVPRSLFTGAEEVIA